MIDIMTDTAEALDPLDRSILGLLNAEARRSNADMARELGLATSTVHDRIRKLEERGVIRGYETRIDPASLGLMVTAFVFIKPATLSCEDDIEEALLAMPEALEIHKIAGDDSFLVKVRARDNQDLAGLLRRGVEPAGVGSLRTTIVLETSRERLSPLTLTEVRPNA